MAEEGDAPLADEAAMRTFEDGGDPREWGTPEGRHVLALLWDPPVRAARGPRKKLSLSELISAAVELADAEGYEALTIRALAKNLGIGTMSLYTYVQGKSELLELMIDRVYGERSLPAADLRWRARYEQHAHEAMAMYQRHPWLVQANLWRLPLGPNVIGISEDLLRIGESAGLKPALNVRVSSLLESFVFGKARSAVSDNAEALRTGQSTDDFWNARSSFWGTYFDFERYPAMVRTWEANAYEESDSPDQELDFGLSLVLDSVERLAVQNNAVQNNAVQDKQEDRKS